MSNWIICIRYYYINSNGDIKILNVPASTGTPAVEALLRQGYQPQYLVTYPLMDSVGYIGVVNEYYKKALADALAKYYLVIWKNKAPEYLTLDQIQSMGREIQKDAKEILQQGLEEMSLE